MGRFNEVFDSADESGVDSENVIRPLWTLLEDNQIDDDKVVHRWALATYQLERKRSAKYREVGAKHALLYRGKHYSEQTSNRARTLEASVAGLGIQTQKTSKLVINYLYDGVQQRLSRVGRMKAAVDVEPNNTEYSDRISATFVKYWSSYQIRVNELDARFIGAATAAYINGEAYIYTRWDPEKGQVSNAWKEEERDAEVENRPPVLDVTDETGKPVKGEDGKPLRIEKPFRVGDVSFDLRTPQDTLVEYCGNFDKAKYFVTEDWFDIDEVRARYPNVAQAVSDQENVSSQASGHGWIDPDMPGKVKVCTLFHRATEFLGSGRFIVFTRDVVLENKPLKPEEVDIWPLIRLTDIDLPNEQRGISFFTHAKSINAFINDLMSMTKENTVMMARPRWLIPTGSKVKREALGNAPTMIEFSGPVPPQMVGPPPMSQEIGIIRRDAREDLMRMLRISEIAQGKIPPNVRSAMALQLIDEQDEQRQSNDVAKYDAMISKTLETAIKVAACYYEKDDMRLLPIVGRDQRYMLKQFDPKHLTKNYTIKFTRSSTLSTSKAARTEMLIELKKAFPTLVRDEQVADMLEFAESDRFYDQASVASKAAEAENEDILNGEEVDEPASYEASAVHWTIHVRELQNRGYKTAVPDEIRKKMEEHIKGTEYLMLETAKKNPAFGLELVKLPQFPIFFELGLEDRVMLDRARTGAPMSLVEIFQLYDKGVMPAYAGQGTTSQPGGVPNPSASAGAEISPALASAQPQAPQEQAQPSLGHHAAPTSNPAQAPQQG